jgi:putative phosphoribosyl transferase
MKPGSISAECPTCKAKDQRIPEAAQVMVKPWQAVCGAVGLKQVSMTGIRGGKKLMKFLNREDAGRQLAEKLREYADRPDVEVVGLARGGVPVAARVARRLRVPMDVFAVRKVGLPGHPELAMGAVGSGGIRVRNQDVMNLLSVPEAVFDRESLRENVELERQEHKYREGLPSRNLRGRTVISVDDGIASGASMRAAVAALREQKVRRIVVATPVVVDSTLHELRKIADVVVALVAPAQFFSVGEWYEHFEPTTDAEVCSLLEDMRFAVAC